MKFVISWRQRPAASSREYEAAHERVLEICSEVLHSSEFTDPRERRRRRSSYHGVDRLVWSSGH